MSKWRVASYKLGNESEKTLQLKFTVSIQSNNNASHKPDQYTHWHRNKELEPRWKSIYERNTKQSWGKQPSPLQTILSSKRRLYALKKTPVSVNI